MAQDGVSKAALLQGLRSGRDNLISALGDLPESAFDAGCYENGWNARQVLAHIAGIEWTYPRLIGVAEEARSPERPTEQPPEKPNRPAQGGIGSYNDRTVQRYAGTSAKELLAIFDENRAKTIAAVEAADDDLFKVPVRSAGGIPGPLGTVLNFVAVMHVDMHVKDIQATAGG